MSSSTSSLDRSRDSDRARETRAIVLKPGAKDATLASHPEPGELGARDVLVRTLLTGIDATDLEVLERGHEATRAGDRPFVLGHECVGEVLDAPRRSNLERGDRVVPMVRHGCGKCEYCDSDRQDLCTTDEYVEHGIVGADGFMRSLWTDDYATLVRVPSRLSDEDAVLTEPLSVVVKALEVARDVQRARLPKFDTFHGQRALIAGTGSLGTLAAFLLTEEGVETYALDRSAKASTTATLLNGLRARHVDANETSVLDLGREVDGFDLIIEATGSPKLAFEAIRTLRPNGIIVMLGVPGDKPAIPVEADDVMRSLVLHNQVVVGSVNSRERHFVDAMEALMRFRRNNPLQLDLVLSHRYRPEQWEDAFHAKGDDLVKKAIDWRE